jgi:NAD(P)-dependent dehydrogenase (short-subunit alcohol dehydrogenase family)
MADTQKTAIVTGGSQGIGAGLVKAFLDRGYNVVANSRNITESGAYVPALQTGNFLFLSGTLPTEGQRTIKKF